MTNSKGLLFTREHEWVKVENERAYIGITEYAEHSLGDIVFVELPKLHIKLMPGDVLGVVESVKTVAEVYIPVAGTVVEINESLANTPEMMNKEPYKAWIAAVEMDDRAGLSALMNEEEYTEYCQGEGK